MKIFNIGASKAEEETNYETKIRKELSEVKTLIDNAYSMFNICDDNDLVDSYIYEIQSLNKRYEYLLKKAKENATKEKELTLFS